ncbi:Fc.00g066080.m01.CDS01 [Cosmosporella sp. VM-42]
MAKNKMAVPDAWEDDWESQADKSIPEPQQAEPQAPLSKAERLAKHAETNRKLWESAETPQTFHYLEANSNVPLANNFKPQVKVLSRKPVIAKRDPVTGLSQLTIDDDGDEPKQEVQLTPEQIRAKQKKDHEDKQRRYEEARAKIFGSNPSSGASSPGTVTPPRSDGFAPRGRGRGRGGYRNNNENRQFDNRQFDNRRSANLSNSGRELYDPNSSPKPEASGQRLGNDISLPVRNATPREEQQQQQPPIRAPRGPDGSGRGGFGFARRGAKES